MDYLLNYLFSPVDYRSSHLYLRSIAVIYAAEGGSSTWAALTAMSGVYSSIVSYGNLTNSEPDLSGNILADIADIAEQEELSTAFKVFNVARIDNYDLPNDFLTLTEDISKKYLSIENDPNNTQHEQHNNAGNPSEFEKNAASVKVHRLKKVMRKIILYSFILSVVFIGSIITINRGHVLDNQKNKESSLVKSTNLNNYLEIVSDTTFSI